MIHRRGPRQLRVALWLPVLHGLVFVVMLALSEPLTASDLEPCAPESISDGFELCLSDLHQTVVAGRDLHPNTIGTLLFILDLPALLVMLPIDPLLPVPTSGSGRLKASYVIGLAWLLLGTLQWWLVGRGCRWLANRRREE